jgi:two-component system, chemotaxis family, protein-glutamate methylesterase/glutaminase
MDINMPRMDGFEATRRIMETQATPVVIVTASADRHEVAMTFRAMEAGALAVLAIPPGVGHPEHEATARELLRTVKLMAEVKVVRRWRRTRTREIAPTVPRTEPAKSARDIQLVAIGASTGGPPVLQTILCALPRDFPAPVLIVQHIAAGFVAGFVEWLAASCRIRVQVARHGETLLPGHAYVAPDETQMRVSSDHSILLRKDPPENGLRPAVSCLFRSVAQVFGHHAIGVLLTGMGKDGAAELGQIKAAGGLAIAQSGETCVVNGMPGEAVRLEATSYVLPPEKIAAMLIGVTRKS